MFVRSMLMLRFYARVSHLHTEWAYMITGGPSSQCYPFFFPFYANVQANVTFGMYYYITTEFDYAKRDSGLTAYGGVVLQRFEFIKVCMGMQRF